MLVLKCFSDLLLCSYFDQKSLKFVIFFFVLMSVWLVNLTGYLVMFRTDTITVLYREISKVKCFSLWVICKDSGSDPRTFFSLQVERTKKIGVVALLES